MIVTCTVKFRFENGVLNKVKLRNLLYFEFFSAKSSRHELQALEVCRILLYVMSLRESGTYAKCRKQL